MNVIIDYKVGNLDSVQRGFQRVQLDTIITNDVELIKQADCIILPGVGAFKNAMEDLEKSGLIPYLNEHVKKGKLLIGICLGMQLLFDSSNEFGFKEGLAYIDGTIEYLDLDLDFKVPHMGWNNLLINQQTDSIKYITENDYVYFVHSYYAKTSSTNVIAYTDYGVKVPAIVQKNNVLGLQFHPEKSGAVGMKILKAIKEMI